MIDKIDKQQIRTKILELLKLDDHAKMTTSFGMCFALVYDLLPTGTDMRSYSWCQVKAKLFGTNKHGFVSQPGYMNPRRREFCHYLLDCLDKEPDND